FVNAASDTMHRDIDRARDAFPTTHEHARGWPLRLAEPLAYHARVERDWYVHGRSVFRVENPHSRNGDLALGRLLPRVITDSTDRQRVDEHGVVCLYAGDAAIDHVQKANRDVELRVRRGLDETFRSHEPRVVVVPCLAVRSRIHATERPAPLIFEGGSL